MIDEKDNKVSQFKYLSEALFGNISIQKESIASIENSVTFLRKEFDSDISNRETDLKNLNYISKDIKDNFQFTLSIIDEITSIDELINQLNTLALHISVEASKIGEENGEIFQNLAKSVREKGDEVQKVVENIFVKEVKNKSFSEHNRYVKNSILPQIDDRVKSLGEHIEKRDEILKEFQKTDDLVEELHILSSGNKTILNGIMNISDAIESYKIDQASKPHKPPPPKKLLNKKDRGTKQF